MSAMSKNRRLTGMVVTLVATVALLGGCAGQRTPGGYGDSIEENFKKGCETTSASDAPSTSTSFNVPMKDFCQCAYDRLSAKKGGVSFNEFKKVVDDQIDNPGPLPESFTKVYADCNAESSGSTPPSVTTTPGG